MNSIKVVCSMQVVHPRCLLLPKESVMFFRYRLVNYPSLIKYGIMNKNRDHIDTLGKKLLAKVFETTSLS